MNTQLFRHANSIEILEARIAPAVVVPLKYDADLAATFVSMTINGVVNPAVVVPGQTGTITINVTNLGNVEIDDAKTCLNIWLTPSTTAHYATNENKIVDGLVDIPEKNIAPGESFQVTKPFTVPDFNPDALVDPTHNATHQDYLTPGRYYIIGEIDGGSETDIFDGFGFPRHTNNFAASGQFDYAFQFGTVNGKSNVGLHFKGGANGAATYDFSLKGEGTGELKRVAADSYDLVFKDTDEDSVAKGTMAANVATHKITLEEINADSPINEVVMPTATSVTGDISLLGVTSLKLGPLFAINGNSILLGGDPATVDLGPVSGYTSLIAPGGLDKLDVEKWDLANTNANLTAPFVSELISGGVFDVNLTLNGVDDDGFAIKTATIIGTLQGTTWTITGATGKVGTISANVMDHWTLSTQSSVDELKSNNEILTDLGTTKIQAVSFGKITARTTLGANLLATGSNGNGIGIGAIAAGTIDGAKIKAADAGITSVNTGQWINGGTLEADFLGQLTTTVGDFTADLALNAADPKGLALGSAAIKGDLHNNVFAAIGAKGKIGPISAHKMDHWDLVADGPSVELKSETDIITDRDQPHLQADSFGKITAGGKIDVSLEAAGKDAKGLALGALSAQTVDSTNINAAAGGIASVNIGQWINGGSVTAIYLGQLTTTGAGGNDGDFTASLTLTGADPGGTALGGATIAGSLQDAGWSITGVHGRIGSIAAKDIALWSLTSDGDVKELKTERTLSTDPGPPEITAATFGKITVGTTLDASIEATGADAKGLGIGTLTADIVDKSTILASGGGIGTVGLGEWNNGGELKAKFLKKLSTAGGFLLDGDFAAKLTLTDKDTKGMSLGGATIAGAIRNAEWAINISGSGNVGDIKAGALFHSTVAVGGAMSDFMITKDFDVASTVPTSLSADTFDSIVVGGFFNGSVSIDALNLNAEDVAIKKIAITTVKGGADILAANGGISKMDIGEWIGGGSLIADWIGTLTASGRDGTSGDFTPTTRLDAANSKGAALGKAVIAGVLGSGWTVKDAIGAITAREIGGTWLLAGDPASSVDSITTNGNFAGEAKAGSFGAIKVLGDLGAKITADDGTVAGSTIKTVDAKNVAGATLKAPGGIDKVTVANWTSGSIDAGKLGVLNVTGKGAAGNLASATIALGASSATKITVKGQVTGTNITAAAGTHFTKITAFSWTGGKIDGGTVGELTMNGGAAGNIQNATFHFTAPVGPQTQSLGKLTAPGSVSGDTFTIDGSVGTINVGSASAVFNITGNVSSIVAGALGGASFGLGGTTTSILVGAMDGATINSTGHDIGSFQVIGIKGQSGPFFKASNVTAGTINTLVVNDVDETNTGSPYGFTADVVKSYLRKKASVGVFPTKTNLGVAGVADVVGKYSLTIV